MKPRWHLVACWLLAGLLAWAGAAKAINPTSFAESIMGFHLVSWPVAVGMAYYLPWLELTTAAGLVVGRWRVGALIVATGLFTGFAVLWTITWVRGVDVTCGCFGGSGHDPVSWSFARAIALAGLTGWLLFNTARCGRNS